MYLERAKKLRRNSTPAEMLMWNYLRRHHLAGLKFKRQQVIGRFIVDFVCFKKKLIIEVDGGQHAENREYDDVRTAWLKSQGFTVMRFWNNEVLINTDVVLEMIHRQLTL